MKQTALVLAISTALSSSLALAGETSIGGDIDTRLDIKSFTRTDTGDNNTATFNANTVSDSTIGGDFKADTTTEIIQTSEGSDGKNLINMGAISGYNVQNNVNSKVQTGVITQLNNGERNVNEITLGSAISDANRSNIQGDFNSNVKLNSVTQANFSNNDSRNQVIAGSAINSNVGGNFKTRVRVNGDITQSSADDSFWGSGTGSNTALMATAAANVGGNFDSAVNVGGDIVQSYWTTHDNHLNLGSVEKAVSGDYRSRVSVDQDIVQSGKTNNTALLGAVAATYNGNVDTRVKVKSLNQTKSGYVNYGYGGNTFVAGSVYGDENGSAESTGGNFKANVETGAVSQSGTSRSRSSAEIHLASLGGKIGGNFNSKVKTGDITQAVNTGTNSGYAGLEIGGVESNSENTGDFTANVTTGDIYQHQNARLSIANIGDKSKNSGDFYARVHTGDITQNSTNTYPGSGPGRIVARLASINNSQTHGFKSVVDTGDITQTHNGSFYSVTLRVGSVENSDVAGKFDAKATVGNIVQTTDAVANNEINIASVVNSKVSGNLTTRVSIGDLVQTVSATNENAVTNIGSIVNDELYGY